MPAKRYTSVISILRRHGPQLSSAVAARLVEQGASSANARKMIQRAGTGIKRLSEIVFPHRDGFLYLPEQHDTAQFWECLLHAFRATNSVYGLAIDALSIRGGSVPGKYFAIVSGSPLRMRGHISADRVRDALQRLGVVSVLPHPEWDSIITLRPDVCEIQGVSTMRARMLAEDIVAEATMTFVQRAGLGSYGKVKVRTVREVPAFGPFNWDITAPCYVAPLRRYTRGQKGFKPGFLAADILLGAELGLEHVRPFLHKTEIMRRNPRNPLFLSLLIADRFSAEALRAGKEVGHLMLTTETLFTKDIAEALNALIQVLTNAASAITDFPDLVYTLFDQLSALEGSAASMRGPLFELWLARYLFLQGWSIVGVGHRMRVRETGEIAEVDVLAEQSGSMRIRSCEAKAHTTPVSLDEVKDWLTRQVPRIRKAHLQYREGRNPDLTFEFWTTNVFSPEALDYLKAAKDRTTAYSIRYFDRTQLEAFAREAGDAHLTKILNDFFLKNTTSGRLLQAQRRRNQLAHLSSSGIRSAASSKEGFSGNASEFLEI